MKFLNQQHREFNKDLYDLENDWKNYFLYDNKVKGDNYLEINGDINLLIFSYRNETEHEFILNDTIEEFFENIIKVIEKFTDKKSEFISKIILENGI